MTPQVGVLFIIMADTSIAITAGTGTSVDTRTESTNGNHRQVIVLGDPSTNAGVAPVDATAGLKVDLGTDNDVVVSATNLDIRDLTSASDSVAATQSGTWNITNVSGTVSLPVGASTAAKQPALGIAGTASADVITVQGITSMTPLKVDGSAVTQPVSASSLPLPTGASTLAEQQTQTTSLQLIDDTVYTDGTGTPSKAIAVAGTDGTNPQIIKTDTAGELQVDVLTMPTVAVTQSGTWDEVGINDSGNSITVDYDGSAISTSNPLPIQPPLSGYLNVAIDQTGNNNAVDVLTIAAGDNNIGNVDIVTLPSLPAGTNAIGKLSANSGVDIGDVDVTSISAGTNLIGDVGIQPRTTNGLDTFMASGSDGSSILVATAQAVKASAGKVYGYYLYNPESAVTFVHFYNTASGSVTVGTTNPLFTLQIPPASAANLMSEIGITFGTAITIAATTTAGGNTAPATGISATVWFK